MLKIHKDAVPIIIATNKQVGWQVETKAFVFDAIQQNDGTINMYVEWGDDQPGDMANFPSWEAVQVYLDVLLEGIK